MHGVSSPLPKPHTQNAKTGEPLRLFLLVSRPHTSNSSKSRRHDDEASAFDRSWRRFAGEGGAPLFLRAEARVYVGERQQPPQQEQEQEQGEGGGEGEVCSLRCRELIW